MTQTAIKWDGKTYPYIPPKKLNIHASLPLHTAAAEKIDSVTYEVVRHAMWNINVEHGNTIMKISGSPSCAYGHDFNPSLMDENGDFVFFGAFSAISFFRDRFGGEVDDGASFGQSGYSRW